jgi:hypothetical protein
LSARLKRISQASPGRMVAVDGPARLPQAV